MTKAFKTFFVVWIISVLLFNILSFVVPNFMNNPRVNQAVGFISIDIAFLIILICGYITFKENDLKKVFLNLPLLYICNTGMFIIMIFGVWSMIDSRMSRWVSIVVCVLIIAIMVVNLILAKVGSTYIESVDKHIETKTMFLDTAKKYAKQILTLTNNEENKKIAKELLETITYSNNSKNEITNDEKDILENLKDIVNKLTNNSDSRINVDIEKLINKLKIRNV